MTFSRRNFMKYALGSTAALGLDSVMMKKVLHADTPVEDPGDSPLGERTALLKQQMLDAPYDVDMARIRAYTNTWKQMGEEGDQKPCTRAALAFAETLRTIEIHIGEGERLVGTRGGCLKCDTMGIERWDYKNSFPFFNIWATAPGTLASKSNGVLSTLADGKKEMKKEILPYWKENTVHKKIVNRWIEKGLYQVKVGYTQKDAAQLFRGMGGLNGFSRLISKGMGSAGSLLMSDPETVKPEAANEFNNMFNGAMKLLWNIDAWDVHSDMSLAGNFLEFVRETVPEFLWIHCPWLEGHIIPGFKRVIALGFDGMADHARESLSGLERNDTNYWKKKDFYESVIISSDAVKAYANRYAALATKLAARADSPERKAELMEVAECCRRVPSKPPETFIEAIQSLVMSQTIFYISSGFDSIFSPGRVDQYLYPFYQKDLAKGIITPEDALGLIEEYSIKVTSYAVFGPNNVTIGGLDRNGNDATNELSYMFLEALENIKSMGLGLAVRISDKTPRDFLIRACKTYQKTAGVAFHNDEISIRDLVRDEHSLMSARDYCVVGCTELHGNGDDYSPSSINGIWLPGVLELALNSGKRLITGNRQIGLRTPDPRTFKTFDDLKDAFEKQMAYVADVGSKLHEVKQEVYGECLPNPVLSASIEGCLESGMDACAGGATYSHGNWETEGIGTVTDSLAAIKWAVFDEKIVSMNKYLRAMANGFVGYKTLRHTLLSKAPKYGNDDPRADDIARWVLDSFTREGSKHRSFRGNVYKNCMISAVTNTLDGLMLGATPDGRLPFDPVSNGISPSNGAEKNGMTAALNSASLVGDYTFGVGVSLNMRITPEAIRTDRDIENLASALEAYFAMKGRMVQFLPVSAKTMKDAQRNPNNYPDLTVKVTGFSHRFNFIPKIFQDDIIARAEFNSLS